jgi:formylglycine-generating enzyme required for sulfatase activity
VRSLWGIIIKGMVMVASVLVCESSVFAQNLESIKTGVVKITTGTGQVGTGFIVRVEQEVVYIITAAHVIAGEDQPEVEFFTKRNVPVKSAVLPGAELNDDIRGLALVQVRGEAQIPDGVTSLSFSASTDLVSGGEDALIIGHSGGGGNWAVLKRNISNRVGRDISLDPGVASRFSGGPIIVQNQVVGIVMSNRDGFGLGITHKSVLNYMEGFGVVPSTFPIIDENKSSFIPKPSAPTVTLVPPLTPSSGSLPQNIIGKDGAPMVLVPAGEFTKGSSNFEDNPPRKQFVKAFYMDKYEVTVERYAKFLSQESDTQRIPAGWDDVDFVAHRNHPVAGTNYFDADLYCLWAGKRLPTNAEWEKAARGTDNRLYPWGNQPPNETITNFNKNYCFFCNVYDEKISPVGTFEKDQTPFGIFDMAGNVTEWVKEGNRRGGDWRTGWPGAAESMELAQIWPSTKGQKNPGGNPDQGFRCAQDAP